MIEKAFKVAHDAISEIAKAYATTDDVEKLEKAFKVAHDAITEIAKAYAIQ